MKLPVLSYKNIRIIYIMLILISLLFFGLFLGLTVSSHKLVQDRTPWDPIHGKYLEYSKTWFSSDWNKLDWALAITTLSIYAVSILFGAYLLMVKNKLIEKLNGMAIVMLLPYPMITFFAFISAILSLYANKGQNLKIKQTSPKNVEFSEDFKKQMLIDKEQDTN